MLELHWAGERLLLLPQRAAALPDRLTLLVADAHIGKAAAFGRLGVPVPEATTRAALARLDAAIEATGARHVIFLGDLLHSAAVHAAQARAAVACWRQTRPSIGLVLVRGNHDRRAGDPPSEWGVMCVEEPWPLGQLLLRHEPDPDPQRPGVAGHVHPGVVLGGRAHQRLRLPCFHLRHRQLLLPAFGEFTGLQPMPRMAGDRIFAIAGDAVRELPAPTLG